MREIGSCAIEGRELQLAVEVLSRFRDRQERLLDESGDAAARRPTCPSA
ncbi:MAG TPA: hypothetical protein VGG06_01815 [Thermoanaerobaculia bacterium]